MDRSFHYRVIFCFSIIIMSFIPDYSHAALPGVIWSSQTIAAEPEAVAWGAGKFVAVGYDRTNNQGLITTSSDGLTWIQNNLEFQIILKDIVWTGAMFVALGHGIGLNPPGYALTSLDGITWSPPALVTSERLSSITWNGNLLVAVASKWPLSYSILTSTNGINWVNATTTAPRTLNDVVWNGTQFIIFGTSLNSTPISLTSPNGMTWTESNSDLNYSISDSAWDGNQVVTVGSNSLGTITGRAATTTDGVTFGPLQTFASTIYFGSILWTGTQFVAAGGGGAIMTSPDGVTWTQQTSGTTGNFSSIAWSGSKLAAVGPFGTIATSQATLPSADPINISLNAASYTTGSSLSLTRRTVATALASAADLYIALRLPDGSLLIQQPDGSFTATVTPKQANSPITTATNVAFNYTFTGAEPAGTYTWYAAFMQPCTLNVIGTMASQPFTFTP